MTLDEVLDTLAHVREPSEVPALARRKLVWLSRRSLDARQLARLRRVAPDLAEGREPWVPGIGESYVLTWSAAGGEVVRLRVERKGEPGVLETRGLGPDAERQIRLVLRVLRMLAAERRRAVPELGALGHVVSCSGTALLDGSSLGVSAAAAFLSSWLGRAPSANVAATASVDGVGTLRAVEHVAGKLATLARDRPDVRLVVASEQAEADPRVTNRTHLVDALDSFGLDLEALSSRASTSAERANELTALAHAQSESYSGERWLDWVDRANALAADPDLAPDERTMAFGHAMLFALHAGDPALASQLGARIADEDLPHLTNPERAWVHVGRASTAIDEGRLDDAIASAEAAVQEACGLRAMKERREIVGRAFGTLGRALMHAERDDDALAWLEKGAAHHREHLRSELARSLSYLATCLRRLGRHEDAARALDTAFEAVRERPDDVALQVTGLFLTYERARLHFERDEIDACLDDIDTIGRRQAKPTDFPRLGTLRYAVACRALRGDRALAEELRELAVASCDATQPGPLRRLAQAVAHVDLADPRGSRGRWDPADLVY